MPPTLPSILNGALCTALLLCALTSTTQANAQALLDGEHVRDSWYIGFGLGSGSGTFKALGEELDFDDVGGDALDPTILSLHFRVGGTLRDDLLLGVDISGLRSQADGVVRETGENVSVAVQASSINAVMTWFPMKEGLFLRGGLGFSNLVAEVLIENFALTDDVAGFGLQIGGGYALWISKSFNLSLNVDFHIHSYDGDTGQPEEGDYLTAHLGFDWF